MKRVLAIDYDDVLFPFMENFVPHFNEISETQFEMKDFFTFEFHQVWGGTPEEAAATVNEFFYQFTKKVDPIEGSLEAIDRLSRDYELMIVTSREETFQEETEDWLHKTFPNCFSKVFLCNTYSNNPDHRKRNKVEVVEEVDAYLLIDDSLKNTSAVVKAGRKAILFGNYAWNRTDKLPEGVMRHTSWQTIVGSLVYF